MSNEVETSTTNGQPDQQAAPKAPSKKEKKKGSEKTDEYLLARFKGDGVKYKAKLIGIDDVPDARVGDTHFQSQLLGDKEGKSPKFQNSLVYKASFRTAGARQRKQTK